MMKNKKFKAWSGLRLTAFLLLLPLLASAVEFDEIKEFGEVFKISAQANDRQRIEVHWKIADGYYLYNNKFLKFKSETAGIILGAAEIPAGKPQFDELLGEEVIKFHAGLTVTVPLEYVAPDVERVSLKVRSQGCMEDVFCYPPTEQLLVVNLPAPVETAVVAGPSQVATTLADVFNQPLTGLGQDAINKAPALRQIRHLYLRPSVFHLKVSWSALPLSQVTTCIGTSLLSG